VPSALHEEIMGTIGKLSAEFWPGAPIIPTMSAGARTAAIYVMPGYRLMAIPASRAMVDDVRVHGKDERALVRSFFDGQEYLYRLVKMLSGG